MSQLVVGNALRAAARKLPQKIAFIQCVGSRDAKLGHLWCSKVCCASALRMARLIKKRRPATEMTFFYIDVQTFGMISPLTWTAVTAICSVAASPTRPGS